MTVAKAKILPLPLLDEAMKFQSPDLFTKYQKTLLAVTAFGSLRVNNCRKLKQSDLGVLTDFHPQSKIVRYIHNFKLI